MQRPTYRGRSLVGGFSGAVLASMCCLPGAVALSIGASVGTAASLFRLQDYQLLFQIAGLALALGWSAFLLRRSRQACATGDHEKNKNQVPLLTVGGFVGAFLVLNLLVIPRLEHGRM